MALLEHHHQIVQCYIQDTDWGSLRDAIMYSTAPVMKTYQREDESSFQILKNVGRDKDKMKRWLQVHIRKRKKSDRWSQKNTTHFNINAATSLKTSFENREMWSGILESIAIWRGGLLASKFKLFIVTQTVTNTDPLQKSLILIFVHFLHPLQQFPWLTHWSQSLSWASGSLVVGGNHYITEGSFSILMPACASREFVALKHWLNTTIDLLAVLGPILPVDVKRVQFSNSTKIYLYTYCLSFSLVGLS